MLLEQRSGIQHQTSASSRIFMDVTSPLSLRTVKVLYSRLPLPSTAAILPIGWLALIMLNVMSQALAPSTLVDSTSSRRIPVVRSGPSAALANAIAFAVASLIDTIIRTITYASLRARSPVAHSGALGRRQVRARFSACHESSAPRRRLGVKVGVAGSLKAPPQCGRFVTRRKASPDLSAT